MLYQSLKLLHIAAAMVWLGGGALLGVVALRARRSRDARVLGDFAKTLPYVGLRLLMPAVVLLLLSGLSLVGMSGAWSFAQLWVWLAVAAFVVAFLVGAVCLSRVGLALDRLAGRPDSGPALRAAVGRWLSGYGVVLAVLAFALWDMVFKPGG
jgi:uncharacterized membrane protein